MLVYMHYFRVMSQGKKVGEVEEIDDNRQKKWKTRNVKACVTYDLRLERPYFTFRKRQNERGRKRRIKW